MKYAKDKNQLGWQLLNAKSCKFIQFTYLYNFDTHGGENKKGSFKILSDIDSFLECEMVWDYIEEY